MTPPLFEPHPCKSRRTLTFRRSVDRKFHEPSLREEFLAAARAVCAFDDEESILWETVNLRKKKSLTSALK